VGYETLCPYPEFQTIRTWTLIDYITLFVCCLATPEKAVYYATIYGLFTTAFVGVPVEVWEAFWAPFSLCGQARREAFLAIFDLSIVTIIDPLTEIEYEAVAPANLSFWTVSLVAADGGAFDCPDGCELSMV